MHANEIALYIYEQEGIELVAISDVKAEIEEISKAPYTRAWNIENVRTKYCDNVYDDYKEMLDKEKPDIAFILCENSNKVMVAEECAKRGINVCVEKPCGTSLEDALKIRDLRDKYNVEIIVNWPTAWRPYVNKMIHAVESGKFGKVKKIYYINGHTGPLGKGAKHRGVTQTADDMTDEARSKVWFYQEKMGGGVFLDICCYGCMYNKWILKKLPKSVYAYGSNLLTPCCDADDNMAAIIKYDEEMSVIEGTWTMPQLILPSGPVVVMEDGIVYCSIVQDGPGVRAIDMYGQEVELEDIPHPDYMKNVASMYVHHIKTGEKVPYTIDIDVNVDIMKILDACIRSNKENREIIL